MKKTSIILLVFLMSLVFVNAQGVTTHVHRQVAPENMQEYLKRETTYWKKFAEQEVKKGNLTFWAVLEKIGGIHQDSSPNILIINTFNNIDEQLDWSSVRDLFPAVKMADISTNELSVDMATIFLRNMGNEVQGVDAVPSEDFNIMKILYHNVKDTDVHLKWQKEKWKPMIQNAINVGNTSMKGWGNSQIVHPSSSKFPYTISTHDFFSSITDAISPHFKVPFAEGFFDDISGNVSGPRNSTMYRLVSFVTTNAE